MIVVLTGTGPPFDRLLEVVAEFARRHPETTIWAQHGTASLPAPIQGEPFLARDRLLERIRDAEAVITHAGSGSLSDAFAAGHVPLVMPRLARHGEVVNDHQLELVEALSHEHRLLAIFSVEELEEALLRLRSGERPRAPSVSKQQFLASVAREVDRALARPLPVSRRLLWRALAAITPRFLLREHSWSE